MKVIIAGGRTFGDVELFAQAMAEHGVGITEVVSGCARGADRMGEDWAKQNGVPVKRFQAKWAEHGKAAGPMRNRTMAAYADRAIVFWDGVSAGTRNMVEEMERAGKWVVVVRYKEPF